MKRRHVFLVGMMGAGKSTVGRVLAERLHRRFVDLDEVIAERAGWSIPAVFSAEGEEGFRRRESSALADVAATPDPLVVACGGGVVLVPENRTLLRGSGSVVWLRATPETLATRVGDGTGRPLLSDGPLLALRELDAERAIAYEAAASHIVDVDGRSVDEVVGAVLEQVA